MMTDNSDVIDRYARRFERFLTGTPEDRARTTAELVAHLSDAAEAGELAEVMSRLGTPETAAATFARPAAPPQPAPRGRRLAADTIDALPLIAVTIAMAVPQFAKGTDIRVFFPPFVGGTFAPSGTAGSPLATIGVLIALAWLVLGVGVMESFTQTTPGKRLLGLRTVTTSGLRVPLMTAIIRRLSYLVGQFALLDWIPALDRARRQRFLERVTHTIVISAPPRRDS
jgi:uncharacterized RDD family membrane protein YckC